MALAMSARRMEFLGFWGGLGSLGLLNPKALAMFAKVIGSLGVLRPMALAMSARVMWFFSPKDLAISARVGSRGGPDNRARGPALPAEAPPWLGIGKPVDGKLADPGN